MMRDIGGVGGRGLSTPSLRAVANGGRGGPSTPALRAVAQDDGKPVTQSDAPRRGSPLPVTQSAAPPRGAESKDLKSVAQQLEAVFVEQLFKAMRATVPQQDGIVTASAGEEIFTGLMDQHLAAETPSQWSSGIADALYRQLLPRIAPSEPNSSSK
jgi:peptidoglycan hydrolase FlgJ